MAMQRDAVIATVDEIVARDPAFNLDEFLAEAQQAFWLVGQAHAECKPDLCRAVLSPELAEREKAAIEHECAGGIAAAPNPQDASTGQLVSIEADAARDTAIVHFRSTWRPISGRDRDEDHRAQNWCFQRSSTAQTSVVDQGDRCDNCGATLQSSAGVCRYCGTPIGSDGGWRVIRIDDVSHQETSEAVSVMREAMAALAAARSTAAPTPTAPARAKGGAGRWVARIFYLVVVVVGVCVFAAYGTGPVHDVVATVVPPLRYPVLKGPLDLTGRVTAQNASASAVAPVADRRGTCEKAAARTDWPFSATLQDKSKFHLDIGLPPAAGGPGVYQLPRVSVKAEAKNRSSSVSWEAGKGSTATLTVKPDGGGEIAFTNLPSTTAGEGPISGHLTWTCHLD